MKKYLYSALCAGSMLALAACSADEPAVKSNDGSVKFQIQLPEATRAFGDIPDCDELCYTVYTADHETTVVTDKAINAFEGHGTIREFDIKLIANQDYTIVFYAHNKGSHFSEYENGAITVHYDNATVNSEADDAFFAKYDFTADGEMKNVTLHRAFAQVNIGTDDLDSDAVNAIISDISTNFEISEGIYQNFNILDGTITEPVEGVQNFATTAPKVNDLFPEVSNGNAYSLLTEVYLLVPAEEALINATYSMTTSTVDIRELNLSATPVQMNYRTNIYGTLLTTNQPFNVVIDPIFIDNYEVQLPKGVRTIDELTEAIANGDSEIYIPSDADITWTTSKTENFVVGGNVKITIDGKLNFSSNQGSGTFFKVNGDLTVTGKGSVNTTGLDNVFEVNNNATLNLSGVKLNVAPVSSKGSAVKVNSGGTANISNTTIATNNRAVYVNALGGDTGVLNLNNVTINQNVAGDLSSETGAIDFSGHETGTFTNVTVKSNATCMNTSGTATITLTNCDFSTTNAAGYAIYSQSTYSMNYGYASITINSGSYYGAGTKMTSCVNISNTRKANILYLKGGKYSSRPVYQTSSYYWENVEPATGFTGKALTGGDYTWEVVAQ